MVKAGDPGGVYTMWGDRMAERNDPLAAFENLTRSMWEQVGAPMLFAHWRDPDFDPTQSAFYYVRVLEIPTPRWTVFDAKFFGVDLPDGVPTSIQERAYTSPIWYTP